MGPGDRLGVPRRRRARPSASPVRHWQQHLAGSLGHRCEGPGSGVRYFERLHRLAGDRGDDFRAKICSRRPGPARRCRCVYATDRKK
jgi:hypothetical protein